MTPKKISAKERKMREDIFNTLAGKIAVKRNIHSGYIQHEILKMKKLVPRNRFSIVGPDKYTFRSPKGEISMIQILDITKSNKISKPRYVYEVFSGDMIFLDAKRFSTKKEAISFIYRHLSDTEQPKNKI